MTGWHDSNAVAFWQHSAAVEHGMPLMAWKRCCCIGAAQLPCLCFVCWLLPATHGSPTCHRPTHCVHPQGSIPKISDLPAPWGPKPFKAPPEQELLTSGYLPPRFPEGWSPLNDVDVGAA